jgi:hypothetical protein
MIMGKLIGEKIMVWHQVNLNGDRQKPEAIFPGLRWCKMGWMRKIIFINCS